MYNTVVFETMSGRSLCPHEAGTAPREEVKLVFEGGLKLKTVEAKPEDEDSLFVEFFIQNLSPTQEG